MEKKSNLHSTLSQDSIDLRPLRNITLSFPSSYLPELKPLTDIFNQKYQPLESFDIFQVMQGHPLSKKLYDDTFHCPEIKLYETYENTSPETQNFLGKEIRKVNQNLLNYMGEYFNEKPGSRGVQGWISGGTFLLRGDIEVYFKLKKEDLYKKYGVKISGAFYYPPGGFRCWHSNSGSIAGWRLYYIRVTNEGKSWFHYVNPENNQLVKSPDQNGYFNLFYVGGNKEINKGLIKNLFWHSVVSHTHRMSLGMRVTEELVRKLIQNHPDLKNINIGDIQNGFGTL